MCRICGTVQTASLWSLACQAVADNPGDWSARGIAAVRPILAAHGLELRASPGDLRGATKGGRQARIRDLDAVWEVAEELLGHPIDPLSPTALGIAADPSA